MNPWIVGAFAWFAFCVGVLVFLHINPQPHQTQGPHYRRTPEPWRVRKIREDV